MRVSIAVSIRLTKKLATLAPPQIAAAGGICFKA